MERDTFDWYYQSDPEQVIMIDRAPLFLNDPPRVVNVMTNEAEEQLWQWEWDARGQPGQIADAFRYTWFMARN